VPFPKLVEVEGLTNCSLPLPLSAMIKGYPGQGRTSDIHFVRTTRAMGSSSSSVFMPDLQRRGAEHVIREVLSSPRKNTKGDTIRKVYSPHSLRFGGSMLGSFRGTSVSQSSLSWSRSFHYVLHNHASSCDDRYMAVWSVHPPIYSRDLRA
jgi:hypothetical protein